MRTINTILPSVASRGVSFMSHRHMGGTAPDYYCKIERRGLDVSFEVGREESCCRAASCSIQNPYVRYLQYSRSQHATGFHQSLLDYTSRLVHNQLSIISKPS
jgi:hypothetical protein